VGSEPFGRPPTSRPENGLLFAGYSTCPLYVRPELPFFSLMPPPPLCGFSEVKGEAQAQPERSRAAARSALYEGDTMGMGGGAVGLCLSTAPRPICGATNGRRPRREDVGRRRGRAVHEVARVPRCAGPDGSACAGRGAEHCLRTIAAVWPGERGAREPERSCSMRRRARGASGGVSARLRRAVRAASVAAARVARCARGGAPTAPSVRVPCEGAARTA
jgi:hypothetical protein